VLKYCGVWPPRPVPTWKKQGHRMVRQREESERKTAFPSRGTLCTRDGCYTAKKSCVGGKNGVEGFRVVESGRRWQRDIVRLTDLDSKIAHCKGGGILRESHKKKKQQPGGGE